MPFRITIAGDIGSGKSTVAKKLADWLGVEPLSTGGIQRQIAQQRRLSVLELNKLAEEDPSIDREIDGYLMRLPDGELVVIHQLSGEGLSGRERNRNFGLRAAGIQHAFFEAQPFQAFGDAREVAGRRMA